MWHFPCWILIIILVWGASEEQLEALKRQITDTKRPSWWGGLLLQMGCRRTGVGFSHKQGSRGQRRRQPTRRWKGRVTGQKPKRKNKWLILITLAPFPHPPTLPRKHPYRSEKKTGCKGALRDLDPKITQRYLTLQPNLLPTQNLMTSETEWLT